MCVCCRGDAELRKQDAKRVRVPRRCRVDRKLRDGVEDEMRLCTTERSPALMEENYLFLYTCQMKTIDELTVVC